MKPRKEVLAVFAIVSLLAASCGGGDDDVATPDDDGVVEITMKDNSFEPDRVEVEAGETVTFRFRNDGALQHEALIGTEAEQDAHEAEMNADMDESEGEMPDEEHGDEPVVTVAPGESGSLDYTFEEAGTILIGCHEPGHYEAGMKATVEVQ